MKTESYGKGLEPNSKQKVHHFDDLAIQYDHSSGKSQRIKNNSTTFNDDTTNIQGPRVTEYQIRQHQIDL